MKQKFEFKKSSTEYTICKLAPNEPVPDWAIRGNMWSVTKTPEELSIICPKSDIPETITTGPIWRAFQICGQFSFDTIGVLSAISECLADVDVSILAVSTFNTDIIFVHDFDFEKASIALLNSGHIIN
jgi:uncharacterized protein